MSIKINKIGLVQELSVNFNLNREQTEAALLLLETRAANMDMSLQEYMHTYHPLGFSEKDYTLSDEYKGYVRFLADDAKAIIKTGKNADFFTFLHEQAHIYRRQLSGALKEKAEKAFGVTDGKWTRYQEELFALGFEEYARLRMAQTEDLREVYEKGCRCMRHIYNGLDRIIELNPDIIKVYDELFTESRFRFKQDEFEKVIDNIARRKDETGKFKSSHVYLGMTPPIYQELGFERLPVMMTARHLKSVMQDWGSDTNVNYHGLTADIIAQIPETIKKPLLIIQSQNKEHPEDIIAIVELKDKNNNPIIIPFSPNKKGYTNDIEIDINLAKSIYGKDNFDRFIQRAAQENRILYLNKKSRVLAIPQVQYPSNQGSQLLYDNIARYQEIVKRKISDFSKLYQTASPEEIETVRQKYIGTDKYLKAPNGKSTKLTEKQWCQVRTTNFKNWFGDWENDPKNASKIVDENGEPMVVYHYTNHKFSSFDKDKARGGKHGEGFYFSPHKLTEYGRYKMACFLNIRNIPEDKPKSDWTFENWHIYGARSIVEKFGTKKDIEEFKNISNKLDELFRNGKLDDMEPLYKEEMRLTDKILHKNNYDGMIVDKLAREIIALEPNQIKSATDNRGYFDINQDNIYYQSQKPAYYSSNQYEFDFLNDPLKKENTTLIPCTVFLEHGAANGRIHINRNYAYISLQSFSEFQLLKNRQGYYFEKDNHTYYFMDKTIEMNGELVNTQTAIDMAVKEHKYNIEQITADNNTPITCKTFQQHLQNMCDNRSTEKQILVNAQILIHKMPLSERLKVSEIIKELGCTTPEKTKENLVKIARNEITLMPNKSVSAEKRHYDYTYDR